MKGKVLVTGGAGYIGSHTCIELVSAGYEPIVVDNFSNSERFVIDRIEEITGEKITMIEGDCTNLDFLNSALKNIELVGCIHFAAYKAVGESSKLPLKYYHNNVSSTVAILEFLKNINCPNFVFSSSCTVYGQPDVLPVTEKSPIKPAESPYGRSKKMCEDIIKDCFESGQNIKALALRYFNPIGAHSSALIGELPIGAPNNLVPYITQTAIGKREELTVFGNDYETSDGTCIRDYIHVVDLAKAHVKAIEKLEGIHETLFDVINLGTGQGNSVLEVIRAFEKVNDLKLNYKIGPRRKGDVEKVYAEVSYALKKLNWKTELSLEKALEDSWRWQQELDKT